MRKMELTDSRGNLLPDTATRLFVIRTYPEDKASRRQLAGIIKDEFERKRSIPEDTYRPSSLTETLQGRFEKSEASIGVAGLTVLCFRVLEKRGIQRPTLYAATKLAEQVVSYSKKNGNTTFYRNEFVGKKKITKRIKSASSRKDIETRFRKHCAVSHIAATSIVLGGNACRSSWPDSLNYRIESFVRTVFEFQRCVVNVYPEYFKDPWEIDENLPDSIMRLEPLDLNLKEQSYFEVSSLW